MRLSKVKKLFLSGIVLTLCLIGLSESLFSAPDEELPENPIRLAPSVVAVVQSAASDAAAIQYGEIRAMVREAVNLAGGLSTVIKEGDTVVLKINLVVSPDFAGVTLPREANGVTTDWRVTKAAVELVREIDKSGRIYIMEGSGVGGTRNNMAVYNYTPENFDMPGVELVAIEEDSGGWHEYDSPGLIKTSCPQGLLHKEYYLNRKYKEADVVISLPCLKNHSLAVVTGAVKNVGIGATPGNIYGIGPGIFGRDRMVNHSSTDLHKWIHDFYLCRPVDFAIMDGLQGYQNGPTPEPGRNNSLNPMNMRLILAGRDAVAVDTVESLIMNWDPMSVLYLRYLNMDRVGNLDTACITVAGKRVDEVRKDFELVIVGGGFGGDMIDRTSAPVFKISSVTRRGGVLKIKLSTNAAVNKVEITVDGKRQEPAVTAKYDAIEISLDGLGAGRHTLSIAAYDRFLSRAIRETGFDL